MIGKKREKSEREHAGDATGASTTAAELSMTGTGAPTIRASDSPDPTASPGTGTPLPDDPSVLKENVKGLKSKLQRHKRQVLLCLLSTVHEIYAAIARKRAFLCEEEVFIPIGNHQLRRIQHYHTSWF